MARAFLPQALPGLLGLFLAGMMAGVMSSCGAFMISAWGLFWRRATPAGAWAAVLVGFGTWLLATWSRFVAWADGLPWAESLRLVWHETGKAPEIYEPWRITFYMVAATLAAVIASLLTRPVAEEKLQRFYNLIDTPIQPGERITELCTLPPGVAPSRRRIQLPAIGLETAVPSRTSVADFIAGAIGVAILFFGFQWSVEG